MEDSRLAITGLMLIAIGLSFVCLMILGGWHATMQAWSDDLRERARQQRLERDDVSVTLPRYQDYDITE